MSATPETMDVEPAVSEETPPFRQHPNPIPGETQLDRVERKLDELLDLRDLAIEALEGMQDSPMMGMISKMFGGFGQ